MSTKKSKSQVEHEQMFCLLQSAVGKIDTLTSDVSNLDKKLDLHIQKTDHRFQNIEELDKQQNDILQQHHQRSDELKKDNELREQALTERLDKLEEPRKWLQKSNQILLWFLGIAGTVALIIDALK